jgi:hypothetical protein
MPILAPVLRPLEAVIPATSVLLAGDDEAMKVGAGATVWLTGPDNVVEDGLDPVESPGTKGS